MRFCEQSGKISYGSRHDAQVAATAHGRRTFNARWKVYYCEKCGFYHFSRAREIGMELGTVRVSEQQKMKSPIAVRTEPRRQRKLTARDVLVEGDEDQDEA